MEKLHKCKQKNINKQSDKCYTREIPRGMYEKNKGSFEVILKYMTKWN